MPPTKVTGEIKHQSPNRRRWIDSVQPTPRREADTTSTRQHTPHTAHARQLTPRWSRDHCLARAIHTTGGTLHKAFRVSLISPRTGHHKHAPNHDLEPTFDPSCAEARGDFAPLVPIFLPSRKTVEV